MSRISILDRPYSECGRPGLRRDWADTDGQNNMSHPRAGRELIGGRRLWRVVVHPHCWAAASRTGSPTCPRPGRRPPNPTCVGVRPNEVRVVVAVIVAGMKGTAAAPLLRRQCLLPIEPGHVGLEKKRAVTLLTSGTSCTIFNRQVQRRGHPDTLAGMVVIGRLQYLRERTYLEIKSVRGFGGCAR